MSRDGHGVDLKADEQLTTTTGKCQGNLPNIKNVPLLSVRVKEDFQYKADVTNISFYRATTWKCHQIKPPNPNGTAKIERPPI